MKRKYYIYDVFTSSRLAGNPLAIVLDAEGLDGERMQSIAREFNLSETVFITAPRERQHTARLRIFTPGLELPFAGHPTIGAAVALGARQGNASSAPRTAILMLEEAVGAVRCVATVKGDGGHAEFDLPRLPEPVDWRASRETLAAALGLGHHEIGFENHEISAWSAGVPFACVPVADLEAAGRARLDAQQWEAAAAREDGKAAVLAPYVYCRETVKHDHSFHARLFAPGGGIPEDPATGAAAAALAGAILRFDQPVDGSHRFAIEQGIEMGRPSSIRLEMDVEEGRIHAARIGGQAICVAEGVLFD